MPDSNYTARNEILTEAVKLAELGLSVFPLKPKSKFPDDGLWSRRPKRTPREARRAFDRKRPPNIGIRLGDASTLSDGTTLAALDVDVRRPESASECRAALGEWFGSLNDVPAVMSGSGGESRHYWFRAPPGVGGAILSHSRERFKGSDGKQHWHWELDLRGTGKYVVAPPSIHPSGQPYKWLVPLPDDLTKIPMLPQKVIERLRQGAAATIEVPESLPNVSLEELPISPELREAIKRGWLHEETGDRSEDTWPILKELLKAGLSDEVVLALLLNPDFGIADKALERGPRWAAGEVARARAELERERAPQIIIPAPHFPATRETMHDLFHILRKGGSVYRVGRMIYELSEGELHPVTPDRFSMILCEQDGHTPMAWRKDRKGGAYLSPAHPTRSGAMQIMASGEVRQLPNVRGTSKVPLLAKVEGKAELLGEGWHDFNGGLLVTGAETIDLSGSLEEAVETILLPFRDYDFATPEDKARCVAALLTPALQVGAWYTGPTPIQLLNADRSQVGKSRIARIIAAAYGERVRMFPLKGPQDGGVGAQDETISNALIERVRMPLLDNVRGELDSKLLEAAITGMPGETIQARRVGQQAVVELGHMVWFVTGNDIEVTRDLANRSSIINLRKRPPDYQFAELLDREGRQVPPEVWVAENRSRVLGAIYRVLKTWAEAGCPVDEEQARSTHSHSFPAWASAVDAVVSTYFDLPAPTEGLQEIQAEHSDGVSPWLLRIVHEAREKGFLNVWLRASDIGQLVGMGAQAVGRKLGSKFRRSGGNSIIIENYEMGRRRAEVETEHGPREVHEYLISPIFD